MLYAMMATTLAGLSTALGGALGALRRPGRRGMAFSCAGDFRLAISVRCAKKHGCFTIK